MNDEAIKLCTTQGLRVRASGGQQDSDGEETGLAENIQDIAVQYDGIPLENEAVVTDKPAGSEDSELAGAQLVTGAQLAVEGGNPSAQCENDMEAASTCAQHETAAEGEQRARMQSAGTSIQSNNSNHVNVAPQQLPIDLSEPTMSLSDTTTVEGRASNPRATAVEATAAQSVGILPRHKKRPHVYSDPLVTWDIISQFSVSTLTKQYRTTAPVTWQILWNILQSEPLDSEATRKKSASVHAKEAETLARTPITEGPAAVDVVAPVNGMKVQGLAATADHAPVSQLATARIKASKTEYRPKDVVRYTTCDIRLDSDIDKQLIWTGMHKCD